jgi:hypothetical protein
LLIAGAAAAFDELEGLVELVNLLVKVVNSLQLKA